MSETEREPHTQGVCQCLCLARTSVCEGPDRGGQAPGMAWGHGQAGGRASLSPHAPHGPRARWQVARSTLARARAFARLSHTTLFIHTSHTRAHCIYHISQTVTHEYREELTRACRQNAYTLERRSSCLSAMLFGPLSLRARCQNRMAAHGRPWQPMAAAARLAARGAWRVHGASHRAMARGARHVAHGTWLVARGWVGGTCMARSRRVSSSLSSG